MRCLGLDLGSKTLGIAISDRTNTIASVYTTIFFKDENYTDLVDSLNKIVIDNNIDLIVLGLPLNMNNTMGPRADITLKFKKLIEEKISVKVELVDERLTSVISNNVLIDADISRKKRKKKVDGMAAVIILQSFLDRKGKENG